VKKKMLLLFSHQLTQKQKEDAIRIWGVEEFISLPESLQCIWSDISPDLASLEDYLKPIKAFVDEASNENDLILIQGDFGASYMMVNESKKRNLTPVYATTQRVVEECIDGDKKVKKSIFEHRRFRKYEY